MSRRLLKGSKQQALGSDWDSRSILNFFFGGVNGSIFMNTRIDKRFLVPQKLSNRERLSMKNHKKLIEGSKEYRKFLEDKMSEGKIGRSFSSINLLIFNLPHCIVNNRIKIKHSL